MRGLPSVCFGPIIVGPAAGGKPKEIRIRRTSPRSCRPPAAFYSSPSGEEYLLLVYSQSTLSLGADISRTSCGRPADGFRGRCLAAALPDPGRWISSGGDLRGAKNGHFPGVSGFLCRSAGSSSTSGIRGLPAGISRSQPGPFQREKRRSSADRFRGSRGSGEKGREIFEDFLVCPVSNCRPVRLLPLDVPRTSCGHPADDVDNAGRREIVLQPFAFTRRETRPEDLRAGLFASTASFSGLAVRVIHPGPLRASVRRLRAFWLPS